MNVLIKPYGLRGRRQIGFVTVNGNLAVKGEGVWLVAVKTVTKCKLRNITFKPSHMGQSAACFMIFLIKLKLIFA